MDALRINPIAMQSAQFSYRSMRTNPNVVRILGAPAFLHYILMRRAKLQPLLVSSSMVSICADGVNASCNHTASTNEIEALSNSAIGKSIQSTPPQPMAIMRDLPELELDWPHKVPEKEVAVYIQDIQQANDPNLTGTVIDLLF
ncbi:MAG: hypothetical protein DHS20C16_16550 [Phycisphaerae bacterium]|nr:MAG: hypothetical protein DHS20C16_16550 [Phycisphaerae bacterium]